METPANRSFVSGYIPRVIDDELNELLPALPAVLLDGPKGVGKTETASQRAGTVHRLDDPAALVVAQADPSLLLDGERPVLIDEWQRVPPVWDAVRRAVDADPTGGQFLLTGSAATGRATTHSGAGRITALRMRPLTLPERRTSTPSVSLRQLLEGEERPPLSGTTDVGLREYTEEITRSGFPGMRHLSGRALRAQLDGYLDRVVDHDMAEAGLRVRRAATVMAWLRAYAAATSTTTSYDKIRDAATSGVADKPAKTTTIPYRDVLEELRILDPVPAWEPSLNHLAQLTRAPKHQLADPALAGRLLGKDARALLRGEPPDVELPHDGPLLGALFEALATLTVRVFAQGAEARTFHLRTKGGRHEVDLIVERPDGRVLAIEVKLANKVDSGDAQHLTWLRDEIGDQLIDAIILTTGPRAYRRPKDNVGVIPLALLGP